MKFLAANLVLPVAIALAVSPLTAQDNPAHAVAAGAAPVITVHAKKYEFIPAEITMKKDQAVKLDLTSDDVEHSLEVPGLGINSVMKKGDVTEVDLTPTQIGDFKGKCGKFCGFGHGKMHFVVHVVN
jgi:cytochrome c oxidase subunit II